MCVRCIPAPTRMLMHVCTCTCTSAACAMLGRAYLARCLLEQREGSLSQLPLESGVTLEGRGSLAGLGGVRKTFIADFHAHLASLH